MDTQTILIIIALLLLVCYMNQETNRKIDIENNKYNLDKYNILLKLFDRVDFMNKINHEND